MNKCTDKQLPGTEAKVTDYDRKERRSGIIFPFFSRYSESFTLHLILFDMKTAQCARQQPPVNLLLLSNASHLHI